ncbi:GNAT family N-acetyltransferase [Glaciecola sp. SC05]|uniref:GNAT family N-acetyltransferase n=1 Tax=Glaciecola sp. SC05 TaxID=1987355 RepID=UPI0035296CCD
MTKFRTAKPSEAERLSALAITSKAHWGYSLEFMEACKAELSHTPEQLANEKCIYIVAVKNKSIIGFYKLENIYQQTILLEALFIDPSMIGRGVGRELYEHAKQTGAARGAEFIEVQSDPNAEGFYKSMGMEVTGKEQSGSIEGRYLPILKISI